MLELLLPARVDNTYRGHKLALWLFGLAVLAKLAIGFGSVFNPYQAASKADGIPLDTYPAAAAQAIVSLFALLGWLHIVLGVICIVVLARYRAMVPLMLALLIVESLGRRAIVMLMPIERSVSSGTVVNLVILAVMIVALLLSLLKRT
ncbi:MAG TPA: hypothetical protein VEU32_20210 [Burkholderiales bacterium]|nr:hypothetical protein [Burkholderiales bacterium]